MPLLKRGVAAWANETRHPSAGSRGNALNRDLVHRVTDETNYAYLDAVTFFLDWVEEIGGDLETEDEVDQHTADFIKNLVYVKQGSIQTGAHAHLSGAQLDIAAVACCHEGLEEVVGGRGGGADSHSGNFRCV